MTERKGLVEFLAGLRALASGDPPYRPLYRDSLCLLALVQVTDRRRVDVMKKGLRGEFITVGHSDFGRRGDRAARTGIAAVALRHVHGEKTHEAEAESRGTWFHGNDFSTII